VGGAPLARKGAPRVGREPVGRLYGQGWVRDSAYEARGVHNACKGAWDGAEISECALCVVEADGAEAVGVDDANEGLGGVAEGIDLFNSGDAW
jgi:hypothetical protein